MKKKIVANLVIVLFVLGLFRITLQITPAAFSIQSEEAYKEVWKLVEVNNTRADLTFVDVNITVSSKEGVNIACSTNITAYFENVAAQESYSGWMNWLNGTADLPYNWGVMDWYVSHSGSLTSITFDQIQYWGSMYADSGGGVDYTTFMGNTYMADWNLTGLGNEPDIIYSAITGWDGNMVKMIDDLLVPGKAKIYIVFKIVITVSGVYVFDIVEPQDVIISPSSWRIGGVKTLFVGSQPSDEYQSIQEAINNATTGDTVIVDSGGYDGFEANVTGIAVKAASGEKPVINGTGISVGGHVVGVLVSAHNVTIEGLTINGSYSQAIAIYNATADPHGAQILNNIIDQSVHDPEAVPGLTAEWFGAAIYAVPSGGTPKVPTVISGNTIRFGTTTSGRGHNGMDLRGYAHHHGYQMDADYQIIGNEITITTRHVKNQPAINVRTGNGSALIENNTITSSANSASTPPDWSQDRSVGIYLIGVDIGDGAYEIAQNITARGNTVTWVGYGFWVQGPHTSNITAYGNSFCNNYYGVGIAKEAGGVHINFNNISGNAELGAKAVWAITPPLYLDATNNWWGNWTGPHHPTLNPNGLGNGVSGNVDFKPWLIQPYPPAVPVSTIHIDPPSKQYWTPAYGNTFNIHVKANVTLLAGFQFNLTWDGTLLNLTRAVWSPLWEPHITSESNTTNSYLLGSAAQSPASEPYPFNGSATLSTLTFKIIYDSILENVTCDLALEDVILAAPGENKKIPRLVYNGTYSCNVTKPKLALMPREKVVKGVPLDFDVKVNVTNVVNLHAFEFNLTYDPALIEGLTVEVKPFFDSSYDITEAYVNNTGKFVFVRVNSIDPPANGSGTLATVTFRVKNSAVWPDLPLSCSLTFYHSKLLTPAEIAHDVEDGTYIYDPVKGDVTRDGAVGLDDLTRVALAFGTTSQDPNWNKYIRDFDLIRDDVINILDVIVVASNFGSQG